jgi:hypothetical protein
MNRAPQFPHVEKAHGYAHDVVKGRILACKWVRKACQRHCDVALPVRPFESRTRVQVRRDAAPRERQVGEARPGDEESPTHQARAVAVFPHLQHLRLGEEIERHAPLPSRVVVHPRKNAKSTTACIIGWWMFAKDDEPGAEVYSGATSEKQAMEVFRPRGRWRSRDPNCRATRRDAHRQDRPGPDVSAQPTDRSSSRSSASPATARRRTCAIVDEYHEHPDSTLHDTMKPAWARASSRSLIISTAGENLAGPCRDDWQTARSYSMASSRMTRTSRSSGPSTTATTGPRRMRCAKRIRTGACRLTGDPARGPAHGRSATHEAGTFKTKHLNMWVGATCGWLNMEQWKSAATRPERFDDFAGAECWVGLDAASKIDMTSMVANLPHPEGRVRDLRESLHPGGHRRASAKRALPEMGRCRLADRDAWRARRLHVIEDDLRAWAKLSTFRRSRSTRRS